MPAGLRLLLLRLSPESLLLLLLQVGSRAGAGSFAAG
jgi:hypothetical protein